MAATFVTTKKHFMEIVTDTDWTGDGFSIVEQTRAGVSRAKADEIARPVGLTDKELARILNQSERTLHRLRPDARLDSNAPTGSRDPAGYHHRLWLSTYGAGSH
jgi:hypothetical protein